MFQTDYGFGPGKWLKWFMIAMAIYAISTFWPENGALALIGGCFAAAGIALARRKLRRDD